MLYIDTFIHPVNTGHQRMSDTSIQLSKRIRAPTFLELVFQSSHVEGTLIPIFR